MLIDYLPIGILVVLAALFAAGNIILSRLLGPRRPNPEKLSPYECGMVPVGTARERFSVKFYLVAMFFIIFDMEIVFLYPWAVVFQEFKLFGLGAMGTFLVILLVGYLVSTLADVLHKQISFSDRQNRDLKLLLKTGNFAAHSDTTGMLHLLPMSTCTMECNWARVISGEV